MILKRMIEEDTNSIIAVNSNTIIRLLGQLVRHQRMERGFMGRIRRSLSRSTSSSSVSAGSSRKNSIMADPIVRLCTDKIMQRDFREFLCSSIFMPELIVYVDFINTCAEMKLLNGMPLKTEIERIYNHHIRAFATDKIFFDDMGALKMELEIKLTRRSDLDATFYNKAMDFCFEKIRRVFDVYWTELEHSQCESDTT